MIIKKFFLDFFATKKKYFIAYIINSLILVPTESIVLPSLYGKLFSANLKKEILPQVGGGIRETYKNLSGKQIIFLIIFVMLMFIIINNFKYALEVIIVPAFMSNSRQLIFKNTIKAYEDNYEDIKSGKTIAKILDVTRNMRDVLMYVLAWGFPSFLGMVLVTIYFFFKNRILGLLSLGGLIALVITLYFIGKKTIQISKDREYFYEEMSENINDRFNNLMNVYLNNEKNSEIKRNSDIEKKHNDLYKKQLNIAKYFTLIMSFITLITFGSILGYLYYLLRRKRISIQFFVSIIIILIYYTNYLIKISNDLPPLFGKWGVVEASNDFFKKIFDDGKKRTKTIINPSGKISFQNIEFKYNPDSEPLFKNFNLNINSNEKVAILGRSGSGKTTLMKLLLSLYQPTHGKILIDGIDISELEVKNLRDNVNYVNQRTQMFSDSIRKNIKYGNNSNDKTIDNIMKKYKLNEVFNDLEKGIDSDAGVQGGNMSLGMQKVVILLRGILKKSKIIIFDEPLAGLDAQTRKKVLNMIMGECKYKTIIAITHDKEILPHMNKVLDLKNLKNQKKNES